MLPVTTKTARELDVLYGLYQLAVDYTCKISAEDGNAVKWIDTRQRLLGKTSIASKAATALLHLFYTTPNVPSNEKALIDSKKRMVKETLLQMQKAEFDIMKKMALKMKGIRGELAGVTRKSRAAAAYINAPRAKMLVS
ncbi:MAG: hypothetical protein HQK83_16385 [Fibrobacteria bacterium]|nr:hypothetical protein [Fibrobacteria bacterium]